MTPNCAIILVWFKKKIFLTVLHKEFNSIKIIHLFIDDEKDLQGVSTSMKIDRIIEEMHQSGLESLFVLKSENIAYITGFKPSSTAVLIITNEPLLFSTKLDIEAAKSQSCACRRIQIS